MTPYMQQTQAETGCLFPRSMRRTGIFNRVIIVTVLLFFSLVTIVQAQFGGGSGTAENPYLVATADHLNNVRDHLNKHFLQTADINLGVAPWNEGEGWVPIGASTAGNRFTGSYDGGGFVIRNLTINRAGQDYQGLFGYLEMAVIRNMKLENVNILGRQSTGALAGWATGATVENVRAGGAIGGTIRTGGLIGYLGGGRLHDVSVDATVQGTQYTGGLVGETVWVSAFGNPTLRHAHARGSVIGTREVGGLIGRYSHQTDTADSYSHASVSGESSVGGFVGYMYADGSGKIIRSYSTGQVTGTGDHVGGFIGQYHSGVTADCLWDIQTSGQAASAGGAGVDGRTTTAMQQRATFQSYNFLTLWTIHEGRGYPFFQNLGAYPRPRNVNLSDLAGEGTVENPYIITSASELNAIRQNPAAHYRLGAAIDMSATVAWNYGLGWAPVGTYSPSSPFTGSVDGQSHAVSNLTVNRPAHDYQGFFGFMENAVVHNLMLTDTHISGRNYTGGLAGYANSCGMRNIRVSGAISGGQRTGGLVGLLANFSWLHDSSSDVSVNGQYGTGGLVGETTASVAGGSGVRPTIRHSSARGVVRGTDRVGGLVGALHSGFIADNYSHGAVTGNDKVGGLVGYTYHGVYRCYSVGPVVGTSEDVGGLIGRWDNAAGSDTAQGTVLFSYWDTETSGQPASSAGEGKTTEQMQQQATYDSFNFFTAWQIIEGGGYPEFQDMSGHHPQQDVNLADLEGTGTEEDPYMITTASELNAVRQDLAAHYRLGNDIDLSATVAWNYGAGWMPLGNNTNSFTGSLDGHGHTLRNLTVNRPKSDHQGLLGYQWKAQVRDLSLLDVNVLGRSTVGGLAGLIDNGRADDISVTGQIIATGDTVGGVAGSSGRTGSEVIQNSFAVVSIRGKNTVGGLVGYNGGVIRRSFAKGDIRGTINVGGLVGYMSHSWAKITDTFSQAAVHGTDSVGGLLGQISFSGTIDNSYSSGPVVGTGESIGGLVGGRFDTTSLVRFSYWDTQASGQAESAGGLGRTTAEMTHPHGENTYVGWDFQNTWAQDVNPRNNAYPYLQGVTPPSVTITTAANPVAGGTTTGGGVFAYGSVVTVRGEANAGYTVRNWTEGEAVVSRSSGYTFTATTNRDLTAEFGQATGSLRIVISPMAVVYDGAQWRRTGTVAWFNSGVTETNVRLGSQTVEFSRVAGWNTVDDQIASIHHNQTTLLREIYTQNMTEYSIIVNVSGEGGNVTGTGDYLHNSLVQLEAVPDRGYRFQHWKNEQGHIHSTNAIITFWATAGRTFTAYFEEQKGALPGVLMLLLDEG